MIRLKDSRKQITYILEDIRAIRSVALMADEEHDWDSEGDVVRLIALAAGPVMDKVEEVISSLDDMISDSPTEDTDVTVG